MMDHVDLPAVVSDTDDVLTSLTRSLGVPRSVLAPTDQIAEAWRALPPLLKRIPPGQRDVLIAKMCVATSVGLFDAAINYIWNATMAELRERISRFGLNHVKAITGEALNADKLKRKFDADLLELALRLAILDGEAFHLLDQSRDLRNNFSAAHPAKGDLDNYELAAFINRCVKYVFEKPKKIVGLDHISLINVLKSGTLSDEQLQLWAGRLKQAHVQQRQAAMTTFLGMYCDSNSSQTTRENIISLLDSVGDVIQGEPLEAALVLHSGFVESGDEKKSKASRSLFEKLGLLGELSDLDRHTLFANACSRLAQVHLGLNNFYNEPPFAERLLELSRQAERPESVQRQFVEVVAMCGVGNVYGISNAAYPSYVSMVSEFTSREIAFLLELPGRESRVAERVRREADCRQRFSELVKLISEDAVPARSKNEYQKWSK